MCVFKGPWVGSTMPYMSWFVSVNPSLESPQHPTQPVPKRVPIWPYEIFSGASLKLFYLSCAHPQTTKPTEANTIRLLLCTQFCTYSLLVAGSGKPDKGENGELVLSPNQPKSRLNQIVKWLKGSGREDPLIVFDECHKAKNLLSGAGQATKTALAVVCDWLLSVLLLLWALLLLSP
jgi:hypothetical protein